MGARSLRENFDVVGARSERDTLDLVGTRCGRHNLDLVGARRARGNLDLRVCRTGGSWPYAEQCVWNARGIRLKDSAVRVDRKELSI